MDKDRIIKLLKSQSEEDNLIGLSILRGRNPSNWGAFIKDLGNITYGYFYYEPVKSGDYRPYGTGASEIQRHLWDKYFHRFNSLELKSPWYEKID